MKMKTFTLFYKILCRAFLELQQSRIKVAKNVICIKVFFFASSFDSVFQSLFMEIYRTPLVADHVCYKRKIFLVAKDFSSTLKLTYLQ